MSRILDGNYEVKLDYNITTVFQMAEQSSIRTNNAETNWKGLQRGWGGGAALETLSTESNVEGFLQCLPEMTINR